MDSSWDASSFTESIVLITSSDLHDRHFGTGFVVWNDPQATYLLTCMHVVREVGGSEKLEIDGIPARVLAASSEEGADIAVLRTERPLEKPALSLCATGEQGDLFRTSGFQLGDKQWVIRTLSGVLGKHVEIQMRKQAKRINAWDLEITDKDPLQPGYSGSPVLDTHHHVLGVVNTLRGGGKAGVAISIKALETIWPQMPPDLCVETTPLSGANPSQRSVKVLLRLISLILLVGVIFSAFLVNNWRPGNSSQVQSPPLVVSPTAQITLTPMSITPATKPPTRIPLNQEDLEKWTLRNADTSDNFKGIVWSGSQFVVVGGSAILTSSDGRSWKIQQNISPLQAGSPAPVFTSIAWSGKQFVAVGGNGGFMKNTVLTSSDGRTWTPPAMNSSPDLMSVIWSGSQFVAVGSGGTVLSSPDGHAWAVQPISYPFFKGIAWSGSQFVAVGGDGCCSSVIYTSPDGRTWTSQTSGTSLSLNAIAWSGSQFVAVGTIPSYPPASAILTSSDGHTWTKQNTGFSQTLAGIIWTGSQFVAVGAGGTVLSSPDGHTWTTHPSNTSQDLAAITWSGRQFVVVGAGGTILTSP